MREIVSTFVTWNPDIRSCKNFFRELCLVLFICLLSQMFSYLDEQTCTRALPSFGQASPQIPVCTLLQDFVFFFFLHLIQPLFVLRYIHNLGHEQNLKYFETSICLKAARSKNSKRTVELIEGIGFYIKPLRHL